jgi:hypothetical protein
MKVVNVRLRVNVAVWKRRIRCVRCLLLSSSLFAPLPRFMLSSRVYSLLFLLLCVLVQYLFFFALRSLFWYLLLPFLYLIVYSFLVFYFPTRHFLSSYVLLLLLLHILLLFRVRIYVLVFCASSSSSLSFRPILFSCSLRTCARCLPSLLHHISFLALGCSVAYVRTYVRTVLVGLRVSRVVCRLVECE